MDCAEKLAIAETCMVADAVELYPMFVDAGFTARETTAALVELKSGASEE